jgi:hypothetical protein
MQPHSRAPRAENDTSSTNERSVHGCPART